MIRAHAQVIRAALLFKLAGEQQIGAFGSSSSTTPATSAGNFDIDLEKLVSMTRNQNMSNLQQLGGVKGVAEKLKSNLEQGIEEDEKEVTDRKNAFGSNTYPKKKGKSFYMFLWEAWQDLTLIILIIAAVTSLALGIKTEGLKEGWLDGGSIAFAVLLVIMVTEGEEFFRLAIDAMAKNSLRCVAIACRTQELNKVPKEQEDLDKWDLPEDELTLLAIVGIKDPCRPGVREAVRICTSAGVKVRMVTGDNLQTAKAIALECGILSSDTEAVEPTIIEGKVFRTEVAKESSDIIILDDNFASVVKVVRWGRSVYANIQKFIQFQLTVNVAALIINVVAAMSSGDVPLKAVQLLWVNLIMDTLGALALATEPPTDHLMHRTPVGRREPLITNIMWRNLLVQVSFFRRC
ncbi:hypothetical protein F2Q70_00010240 [Brassica cretica]|uniref:P-type Cu(+) transporter n=1 Tax=Brassica cretica TaxID=69181 RepID=A0A8S9M909_BRACR|nr:hypothetical protein F2Q70_00010240 [Brassica cretica]